MKTTTIAAALAAIGFVAATEAPAATVVLDTAEYTVTYDNSSVFGWISSWSSNFFAWSFPQSASVWTDNAEMARTLELTTLGPTVGTPNFILQAKPGYEFSDLNFNAGGVYSVFGTAVAKAESSFVVNLNDGSGNQSVNYSFVSNAAGIDFWTNTIQVSSAGTYTQATVAEMRVRLEVTAEAGSFAGIVGHPNTGPAFSFELVQVPVPEPETYALMLAGLGLIGWAARRRAAA